jgi:DNA-binding response OmpR family regulator
MPNNPMTAQSILLVDDDPDILEPLSLLLEAEGFAVDTTTKAAQTYEKVARFRPSLILLDILMSGEDGRTICRKLKDQKTTKHIPVIMMSAHPTAKADSAGCGADDFIAKPFDLETLLTMVKKHLNH